MSKKDTQKYKPSEKDLEKIEQAIVKHAPPKEIYKINVIQINQGREDSVRGGSFQRSKSIEDGANANQAGILVGIGGLKDVTTTQKIGLSEDSGLAIGSPGGLGPTKRSGKKMRSSLRFIRFC